MKILVQVSVYLFLNLNFTKVCTETLQIACLYLADIYGYDICERFTWMGSKYADRYFLLGNDEI